MKKIRAMLLLLLFFVAPRLTVDAATLPYQQSDSFFMEKNTLYTLFGLDAESQDNIGIIKVNDNEERTVIYEGNIRNIYNTGDYIIFNHKVKSGIYKMKKDGSDLVKILDDSILDLTVYNNEIYYISRLDYLLRKVDLDGNILVESKKAFRSFSPMHNYFYGDLDTLYLCEPDYGFFSINKDTLELSELYLPNGNPLESYVISGDFIVYRDDYNQLYGYDLVNKQYFVIDGQVSNYVVAGSKAYYSVADKTYVIELDTKYAKDFIPWNGFSTLSWYKNGNQIKMNSIIVELKDDSTFDTFDYNEGSTVSYVNEKRETEIFKNAIYNSKKRNYKVNISGTIDYAYSDVDFSSLIKINIPRKTAYLEETINVKSGNKVNSDTTKFWYYKNSEIEDSGVSKPYYTLTNISDYNYQSYNSSLIPEAYNYYSVEESTTHYVYTLSYEDLLNAVNIIDINDISLTESDLLDYSAKLFINKSTNKIDEIRGSARVYPTLDGAYVYDTFEAIDFTIGYSYSTQPIMTPPSTLTTYYDKRVVRAPQIEDYTDLDVFTSDMYAYAEKNKLTDIYFHLYELRQNYDSLTDEDYKKLVLYIKDNPKNALALYYKVLYDFQNKTIKEKDLNLLEASYSGGNLAYLMRYFNSSNSDKILKQWLLKYPESSFAIYYELEKYYENEDYKGLLNFADEHYNFDKDSYFLMALADRMGEGYYFSYYLRKALENNRDMAMREAGMEMSYSTMNLNLCYDIASATLELDPENEEAKKYMNKLYEDSYISDGEALVYIIRNDYLHYKNTPEIKAMEETLMAKDELIGKDIIDYLELVKHGEDPYTNIYQRSSDFGESEVKSLSLGNVHYIQLDTFASKAALKIENELKTATKKGCDRLILDLRNNGGGSVDEAEKILDLFLQETYPSTYFYKDGSSEKGYSAPGNYPFKDIYVLVNENSASASEIVALGLKNFLNHVTIVGKTTVGKGVGQIPFSNADYGYDLYLVNFYWNIKEKNIHNKGIQPDIKVESDKIEDYFKAINLDYSTFK